MGRVVGKARLRPDWGACEGLRQVQPIDLEVQLVQVPQSPGHWLPTLSRGTPGDHLEFNERAKEAPRTGTVLIDAAERIGCQTRERVAPQGFSQYLNPTSSSPFTASGPSQGFSFGTVNPAVNSSARPPRPPRWWARSGTITLPLLGP